MKASDWVCPVCGATMLKVSDAYLACGAGHGKLRPAFAARDLPVATRVGYRKFEVRGENGLWRYVPRAHKDALDRAPDPGVVVAQVIGKQGVLVRSFCQAKHRQDWR